MQKDADALKELRKVIGEWTASIDEPVSVFEDLADAWSRESVLTFKQRIVLYGMYGYDGPGVNAMMRLLSTSRRSIYAIANRGLHSLLRWLRDVSNNKWQREELDYLENNLHSATITQLSTYLHRPISSTYVKVLELRNRDI